VSSSLIRRCNGFCTGKNAILSRPCIAGLQLSNSSAAQKARFEKSRNGCGDARSIFAETAAMGIRFILNGKPITLDGDPAMPLLWALREVVGLHGTKFGCGMALCGACTVHVEGQAVRSCALPVAALAERDVTTIEGLQSKEARAIQGAWLELQVPQCGYCQSGQIMSAVALLKTNTAPTDEDIDAAMSGNICRCATYSRIRAAIHAAAKTMQANP
jgi:isoquinoline 1-oxidoreductase subunit alpha